MWNQTIKKVFSYTHTWDGTELALTKTPRGELYMTMFRHVERKPITLILVSPCKRNWAYNRVVAKIPTFRTPDRMAVFFCKKKKNKKEKRI